MSHEARFHCSSLYGPLQCTDVLLDKSSVTGRTQSFTTALADDVSVHFVPDLSTLAMTLQDLAHQN